MLAPANEFLLFGDVRFERLFAMIAAPQDQIELQLAERNGLYFVASAPSAFRVRRRSPGAPKIKKFRFVRTAPFCKNGGGGYSDERSKQRSLELLQR